MAAPPISFVGVSKFSDNFQTILERTFTVANLPVKNIESDRSLLGQRKTELNALATDVQSLRDVFSSLGSLGDAGLASVGTSDPAVAVATSTGAPGPIAFDLAVTSQAAKARETTLTGLADTDTTALSADGIYKLTLGSVTSTIDLSGGDNTLAGLRDAINTGDYGVSAGVLNLSSDPDNPDYRLSITANHTGAKALSLETSSDVDLLTAENQGTDAVFSVDGVAKVNSSNTIEDFAPGLSLTIVGPGSASVVVGDDAAAVKAKLTDFAQKYTAVVSRIQAHIGKEAGVLSGDVLIREAQSALRAITSFSGDSSTVNSIAALGLELDDKGQLSFDPTKFDQVAKSDFAGVRTFLGTATTGFIGNAYSRLSDLADPVRGRIRTAVGFIEESDQKLAEQIANLEERIDLQIKNLEERFGAADTLLANLESQQTLLTKLFDTGKGSS